MTPNEYQTAVWRTVNHKLSHREMMNHALSGMVSEIGELHGLYQKTYQGHEFDGEHAKKECGDLLWMIAEYCWAMGWALEDVMQANIDKLRTRYPDGFDAERSIHRKIGDI